MHRGVTPALLERRVAFPVLSEIRQTPGSGDKLHTKEQKELLPMQFDGIAAEELRQRSQLFRAVVPLAEQR